MGAVGFDFLNSWNLSAHRVPCCPMHWMAKISPIHFSPFLLSHWGQTAKVFFRVDFDFLYVSTLKLRQDKKGKISVWAAPTKMVSFSQLPAVKKTPCLVQLKQKLALLILLELYLLLVKSLAFLEIDISRNFYRS